MTRLVVLLGVLLVAGAAGSELLVNGDFEFPPDSGWHTYAWGDFPDTGNCRLRWRHAHHPDRDFEVLVHKMLNRGFKLYQSVDVSGLDLSFSVSCRLTARTTAANCYAAACVYLEYLGSRDSVLGETRIYWPTFGCEWQNSPVLHLIQAPDTLHWYDYRLGIADELANLPGVNPDSVAGITVGLLSYVHDNG